MKAAKPLQGPGRAGPCNVAAGISYKPCLRRSQLRGQHRPHQLCRQRPSRLHTGAVQPVVAVTRDATLSISLTEMQAVAAARRRFYVAAASMFTAAFAAYTALVPLALGGYFEYIGANLLLLVGVFGAALLPGFAAMLPYVMAGLPSVLFRVVAWGLPLGFWALFSGLALPALPLPTTGLVDALLAQAAPLLRKGGGLALLVAGALVTIGMLLCTRD